MNEVKLQELSTGKEYTLTPTEMAQFKIELSRTAPWRSLRTFILYLLGKDKGVWPRVAPDALVSVRYGNRTVEYEIYGRSVLMNVRTRRIRQFYMGILLVEWVR